eukprot:Platyproteum_vivax@DN2623_c0_g1_i2.p1
MANNPRISVDNLYLKDYGRWWGEKMTMSMGASYLSALGVGSSYGLMRGVNKGGATSKLFINSILNSCGTYGPPFANQAAIITGFYVAFFNLVSWARSADDTLNAAGAGFLAGGLFKITTSYKAAAKYSAAATVAFTAIDLAMRQGYF